LSERFLRAKSRRLLAGLSYHPIENKSILPLSARLIDKANDFTVRNQAFSSINEIARFPFSSIFNVMIKDVN